MSFLRRRTTALIGIFLMLYGVVCIHFYNNFLIYSIYTLGAIICITSLLDLFIHKRNIKTKIYLFGSFVIGLIMYHFPFLNLKLLIRIFGLISIVESIAKFINYYQCMISKIRWHSLLLIDALFYLVAGIICLFGGKWVYPRLTVYLGIYLIFFGFRMLRDGFEELFGEVNAQTLNRRFRISIPIVLTSIIPKVVLMKVENALANHEEIDLLKANVEPDLEIMIHTAPSGHNMMGHIDMRIGESVISYGNYDFTTYRFFDSLGDGVIIYAPRKEYIQFSQSYLDKTLIGFGLKLTDEQREKVNERLMNLFSNVTPWYPRAKRDPEHQDEYHEYSSMLYKGTNCCFYKPKSGRFKNFFIFGTNCALFIDSILGAIGTDYLNLSGMLTPGNFYDYLNSEFKKKNSIVVSRKVYYMKEEQRAKQLTKMGLEKHGTK